MRDNVTLREKCIELAKRVGLDCARNARMDADLYGQRAISETVSSSLKQRYGSELSATTWYGEFRELVIKCIVRDLRRAVA
jgi:IS5 family transposase